MKRVYFIIPAYNEEETILKVLEEWYPIVEKCGSDSRLVIIDDGSKDSTLAIMQEFAKTHAQFEPIAKPNSGHGATILYGYKYAIEHQADYIFQTDSDGQTSAAEFNQFWELKEQYDMIIGHRNKRQDGFSRIMVTKVLKYVIGLIFHVWLTDANTPFRLMNAKVLAEYLPLIPDDYNLTNVLISVIYARKHCKVKYLPITFKARQGGTNSINLKSINRIGRKAVHDFSHIKKCI